MHDRSSTHSETSQVMAEKLELDPTEMVLHEIPLGQRNGKRAPDAGDTDKARENGYVEEEPANFEQAITACGHGKFHYLLALALMPMCCSQLFSSGTVSFILPSAECDLQLSDFEKGCLNAAVYAGNILAGLIWAAVADLLGRRKIMVIGFFIEGVLSLISSFSVSFWMLLCLKIMSGMVISGPNSVMYSYLAETHADKYRPQSIIWTGMFFALAQVVQPVIAFLVIPLDFRVSLFGGLLEWTSWRLFLMLCAVPSIVSAAVFFFLPESPKFLMSKNRQQEALAIFRKIYAINSGKPAHTYPVTSLAVLNPEEENLPKKTQSWLQTARSSLKQLSPLIQKPYLGRVVLIVCIQFAVMICINSIRLWTPQLFALLDEFEHLPAEERPPADSVCDMIGYTMGGSGEPSKECTPISGEVYLRSMLIGALTTLSYLFTGLIINRVGKRNITLVCFPASAAVALALNWAVNADVFMGLVSLFTPLAGNALTALGAFNVDLFPTTVRSMAVSMSITCGRVASLIGNLILPLMLAVSCQAVFFFLSSALMLCSVLAWFLPKNQTVDN